MGDCWDSLPHGMSVALGQLGLCCSAVFPSLLLHKAELGLEMAGKAPFGSRSSSPQASLAKLGAPGQQGGSQWPVASHLHSSQDAGLGASQSPFEFKVVIQSHYLN